MERMDFGLYRPTDLEQWISGIYRKNGIAACADMEDLDHIASLFRVHIAYTEGETKAIYDEEGDCMIFLNLFLDKSEQRLAFFHELCHPAMHIGNQRNLPLSFVALQETQAGLFQQYAALPFYLLRDFQQAQQRLEPATVAEAFALPLRFVRARLERMIRRMRQQREDLQLRSRLASVSAPSSRSGSGVAAELLAKLNRQTAQRRGMKP